MEPARLELDGDLTETTSLLPVPLEISGWAATAAGVRSVVVDAGAGPVEATLLPLRPGVRESLGAQAEHAVRFVCVLGREEVREGRCTIRIVVTDRDGAVTESARDAEMRWWPASRGADPASVSSTLAPGPPGDPDAPLPAERELEIRREAERLIDAYLEFEAHRARECAILAAAEPPATA